MNKLFTFVFLVPLMATAQTNQIFIPNLGQILTTDSTPTARSFYAQIPGGTVYFSEDTVSFVYAQIDTSEATDDTLYRFDMRFISPFGTPAFRAADTSEFYYNFYYPHCDTGITGVRLFSQLDVDELWQGVDLTYISTGDGYITRFTVAPEWGTDNIKWQFDGLDSAKIGIVGELQLHTPLGVFYMPPPIAYSGNDTFTAIYTRNGSSFGMAQQGWSGLQDMYVEWGWGDLPPTGCPEGLEWSTYFGSAGIDYESGNDVVVDGSTGDVFTCGDTETPTMPFAPSPVTPYNALDDAFIAKFDGNNRLEWYTYFGGSEHDEAWSASQDVLGTFNDVLYVTGRTLSPDLVLKFDSLDYQNDTVGHGFLARFSKQTGMLEYSTYFGGTGFELFNKVLVAGRSEFSGLNVYVGGYTESTDFPEKDPGNGAHFQGGSQRGFIARFNSDTLVWSTRFGSNNIITTITDMAFERSHVGQDRLYVVGETQNGGPGFPITTPQGAYTQGFGGGLFDGFIAKFRAGAPDDLLWCTYFGGEPDIGSSAQHERCTGVLVPDDFSGDVYVVGNTDSDENSFPLKRDVTSSGTPYYDSTFSRHPESPGYSFLDFDGFVAKFSNMGEQLWTTYYGNTRGDMIRAITIDNEGNIYIAGEQFEKQNGTGANTPTLPFEGAYNQGYGNQGTNQRSNIQSEIFIAAFNDQHDHIWATFFGGYNTDYVSNYDMLDWNDSSIPTMTGHGLAAFQDESLYLVGTTFSSQYSSSFYPDFPLCDPGGDAYYLDSSWTINDVGEMPYISRFSISAINVGVDESVANDKLAIVWPNPTGSHVWIALNEENKAVLTISDMGGKAFHRQDIQRLTQFDMSHLAPGVYFFELRSEDSIQRFRIVRASND